MKIDNYQIPIDCDYCGGKVRLVSNAVIYGREFGSGKAYVCEKCTASVGTHQDCITPLGSLADKQTKQARKDAHVAFDALWRGKGSGARERLYAKLAEYFQADKVHIGWLSAQECQKVLEFVSVYNVPMEEEPLKAEWRLKKSTH